MEISLWLKLIWKLKCPLKSKIFCWFLFSGKALTWDVLCGKGWEGPGRCYLCKLDAESNYHLGVDCSFTKAVWVEIESKVSSFCMGVLYTYPQENDALKIRNIIEENIDKTNPWGYFDGSATGDPHLCGAGGILYIKDDH